ncbi:signal peptidase I [Weissella coleopterorum]|uniref:Signal peptidase I n=1 Tax=Weissella coleopterorum TaxID=2714949 RepID=A0A6G8AYG2_9LACO|nr:signal peptidase I [Weissella coleopterorum]QIL49992.1 signal peptidase I [Weissella coleopterorum]
MKTFKSIMSSWVLPILIGLALALIIRQFWFTIVRVDGTSMEPNLTNNERVLVLRSSEIKRGSVVVFNAQGIDPNVQVKREYVKRVIGLPGDKVASKDGEIYVNNKKVDQNYLPQSEKVATNNVNNVGNWDNLSELGQHMNWNKDSQTITVPKGKYFVLGDHRTVSNDSRYWGFVPKDKMFGVVKVGFWTKTAPKDAINQQYINFFATK